MKKILIISDIPTHPQTEGCNVRVNNLVKDMKKIGVDIYFLYVYRSGKNSDILSMENLFGKDKLFIYNYKKYMKIFNVKFIIKKIIRQFLKIIGLGKKVIIHYSIDEGYPKSLNKYIKKLHKEYHFDVAWAEYVWFSKALQNFNNDVFKVIDTHDVFTNRENAYLKNNELPAWLYTTKKQEAKGLSRANCVIAIQNNEEKYFASILSKDINVVTIGNSIHVEQPTVVKNKNYIFVGSNNEANQYSVKYFINNILPKIKLKEKDSNFMIIGGICKSLPDSNDYIKLGFVDDISEVYNNSRLVIIPMKSGTGLNIKTIEALGYSKPIVTTDCGAKGLQSDKIIFEVANDDNEFVDKVVSLLNNDELAHKLSNNAFEFSNNYNKEIIDNLQKILTEKL